MSVARAEPVIRAATLADRDALVRLLVAQLREHAIETPEADVARTVAALLRRPRRARFLVAVDGGRPVGVAALSLAWPIEHGGRSAWLEELYVEPDARGRALGTALLRPPARRPRRQAPSRSNSRSSARTSAPQACTAARASARSSAPTG